MSDCQCQSRGSIHVITGPMFSGKTTELFRLVRRHKLAGKRVVIVKSAKDYRFDELQACTHDMNKMEAISSYELGMIFNQIKEYDVIGIDEGQFFPDILLYSQELANMGRTVIIAALNGDYRQKPFPNAANLFSIAEKIEKLSAVCQGCGQSASFTTRILDNAMDDDKLELIGGKETYKALCRVCLLEQGRQKESIENIQPYTGICRHENVVINLTDDEVISMNGKIIEENGILSYRGNECNA